ncbi:uncharacterized protein LOC127261045 [Andrographis paniculata]|uniref:uncharacterized protein LOC127261045 n=1 Tax=Andrographis paniculata TaxID=175694 RepID=UPI0021E6DBED|nr:uncharacterized protein LOC127261045 [Andrographis paniculata]
MEGKGSTLVHLLVIVLSLTAFGFAIAAERRRSKGILRRDEVTGRTYCVYHSDVATGYGVGAFMFLLASEMLVMAVTKCMCFGSPLTPGSNRALTIIYFTSSWATFITAEACLVAGAKKNAYHTIYRDMIFADEFSCDTLRKGIFIAGAVFVAATMILNVYYYMYFTKATTQPAKRFNFPTATIGMVGNV